MKNFIFGEGTPWTYDQLQQKRRVADALLAKNSGAPRNVGEGLSAVGNALAYRGISDRANKREGELKSEWGDQWSNIVGALGKKSTPGIFTPGETPQSSGHQSIANDTMRALGKEPLKYTNEDIPSLINETAESLGMSPHDLATIISYETGGTFGPQQSGPTTQHGTHRGLIQFGEPQANQYGVDWDRPIASQLGKDGAVARYFQENGWRPGMDMNDAYSIVNAGAPGRYNASDANNGGAPGTVADKVAGMDDHRLNAARYLGGSYAPGEQQGGPSLGSLLAASGNPMASQAQQAVLQALIGREMTPEPTMTPYQRAQIDFQNREFEADQSGGGNEMVKSSEILEDGTVIQSTSTGVRVIGPLGNELQGQEAADAISKARELYSTNQRGIYGDRRGGTLESDIELGGEAAGAEALGKASLEAGVTAWNDYTKIQTNIANLQEGIDSIDNGAKAGVVYNMIPNVSVASASLDNVMNRLGLDVVGAVTFGALSAGELKMAMSTAVPQDLAAPELRIWLVNKMEAQQKVQTMLGDAAQFLTTPGNTINDWIKQNDAATETIGGANGYPQAPEGYTQERWERSYDLMTPDQKALFQ